MNGWFYSTTEIYQKSAHCINISIFFLSYKIRLLNAVHACRFIVHIYVHIRKMAEHAAWDTGLDIHLLAPPTDVQVSLCSVHKYKTKHIQHHSSPAAAKGPRKPLLFENEQLLKIWKVLKDSESVAAPLNSVARN